MGVLSNDTVLRAWLKSAQENGAYNQKELLLDVTHIQSHKLYRTAED